MHSNFAVNVGAEKRQSAARIAFELVYQVNDIT